LLFATFPFSSFISDDFEPAGYSANLFKLAHEKAAGVSTVGVHAAGVSAIGAYTSSCSSPRIYIGVSFINTLHVLIVQTLLNMQKVLICTQCRMLQLPGHETLLRIML
jgi:hypothetical protein